MVVTTPISDDRAMNLNVLNPGDAPAASRAVLDGIAADLGFVPNLAAVTAASPTLIAAFDALRRTVADPTFDPVHREIAGVSVGVAVDNAYGVAFHSTVLGALGVDELEIDAMRAGTAPNDPVHAAIYNFARDVVADRGKVAEDVVQRAYDAGITDDELLQIVAECVFASLVGLVDNLAGRVPLDEFLRPQQWKSD
jgi:alkylhydroperoxidase family enzyme